MANTQSSEISQIQKVINKQDIILTQDQSHSNTIMAKTLAELENLAVLCGYKGETFLNYYATKGQTKKEMTNQIVYQMTIFASSYKKFVKNNPQKKYEFPENLSYKKIVELISDWKKILKNDKSNLSLEKYYDSFLKILEGKNLDQYILNEFENIDKDSKPTTKEDLKKALNAGTIAVSLTNEKNKDIEKNILEKGEHKVKVVVGGKREDNKFYQQYEKNDENFKKAKKELNKVFDAAIGYLELYYQINIENELKYVESIRDEIKKEIFQKYEKLKDEFIQKNNSIYDNYDYDFCKEGKLKKLESELEKWVNYIHKEKKLKKVKNDINNAIKVFCHGEEDSNV